MLMMTSSNENLFRITGPLSGKFTGHQWISHRKTSDAELDVFFDLRLKEQYARYNDQETIDRRLIMNTVPLQKQQLKVL